MGIEDRISRKFREIEEDAKKQHERKVKNFLENFANAKKIAEKARIVETLKELEKAVSKERGVKATQVWWTDKAVTYPQSSPVSVHSIGHLEVTSNNSGVFIPKAFGEDWNKGLTFRAGLRWLKDKSVEESQAQLISMIGACVGYYVGFYTPESILVWPSSDHSGSVYIDVEGVRVITKEIAPSGSGPRKIVEDALIDAFIHPAQVSVQTK